MDRITQEKKMIETMIRLYCRRNHHAQGLCDECDNLLAYAQIRLDRCPHGNQKPTCDKCTIHCYKPAMQEKIRVVMRFSGPRMLFHRPYMAISHLFRTMKKVR
ncbi:MAG: nitrous oxide-stimulated promoter family protein [Chloroflexota bacterium]|nr:nitrous oxide-stimulated promoter family protein [Chloroflexota bacterium]MDY6868735.1 nitrous oxide-stimulated promoter family protein [Chloroflexota bacterium]